MKFKISVIAFLFITLISVGNTVYAVSPNSISVDVAPANPVPYSNVTISLSSFAANLDTVNIVWVVDGKNALSGVGKKSFSLTTKAANSETRILVKILLPDGEIDKNITIRPSTLILLWQANDSYVPPFYKGKALPSSSSELKVVAMPEIRTGSTNVDPKNMTYAWKQDYNNMQGDSGYGKNFFLYVNDYLENTSSVSVTASTVDQQYSSESSVNIGTTMPKILFYKKDSAEGIVWEHTLGNDHTINGDEVVIAAPYYISPKNLLRPELIFNWFINDSRVTLDSYIKNSIPLRAQTGASGTSKLKLEIDNTDKIWETAKKEINIQF